MYGRDVAKSVSINPFVFPAPFDQHPIKVRGPILLVKMDDVSMPQNYTIKEYLKYAAKQGQSSIEEESSSNKSNKKQIKSSTSKVSNKKQPPTKKVKLIK